MCREYGLSVIEPKGKGKSHQEWQAMKSKQPTIREQIRRDIDDIVGLSLNFTTFLDGLRKAGYQIHAGNRKHTAVKPPYGKQFIRLDSLGENYTDAAIEQRILSQHFWSKPKKMPAPRRYVCKGSLKKYPKAHGFRALYYKGAEAMDIAGLTEEELKSSLPGLKPENIFVTKLDPEKIITDGEDKTATNMNDQTL